MFLKMLSWVYPNFAQTSKLYNPTKAAMFVCEPDIAGPQSVATFYLWLYFPSAHFQTKSNKVYQTFIGRLIEVKNDGRTLVGIA